MLARFAVGRQPVAILLLVPLCVAGAAAALAATSAVGSPAGCARTRVHLGGALATRRTPRHSLRPGMTLAALRVGGPRPPPTAACSHEKRQTVDVVGCGSPLPNCGSRPTYCCAWSGACSKLPLVSSWNDVWMRLTIFLQTPRNLSFW